jgi:putative transposase
LADYRRYYVPGGTFFFTVVTLERRPILCEPVARRCLHEAIQAVRTQRPIDVVAIALLPDHIHTVWTLPQGDTGYPVRWKRIKEEFTVAYLARGGREVVPSRSRRRQGERGIWQ